MVSSLRSMVWVEPSRMLLESVFFLACICWMRSSTVFSQMSLWTKTGLSWPMR